ncbi:hypothetical protein [Streptomyces sp. 8L]|uniref:hypothetical protein n=1 Tax=Streptomyces sp. 8L TaxID=2877242 RepID=UPI001CD28369|nr:hypothetical protein [Streptomyces sp. 8L]MCA1218412.1 hypothetical protein [Streptomyces sp. 8L]
MIDYDGKRFRPLGADEGESGRTAVYHQSGDLLWGEFSGGDARRGTLTGVCGPDGALDFAYCVVLTDGAVVSGACRSTPELLGDGRVRLTEHWQRFGENADSGQGLLEEIPSTAAGSRGPEKEAER